MLKKLIIFLICKRLGVKKNERFQFLKQRNKEEYYWFTDTVLRKYDTEKGDAIDAHVSLNWLLDDNCMNEIVKEPKT